jgi:cleavage and polyadenylation specificity factor subunit 3
MFSFHLDHAASLPYVIMKAQSLTTHSLSLDRLSRESIYDASHKSYLPFPPVRLHQSLVCSVFHCLLTFSAIDTEDQLYDTKDLYASLDRIEAVDFHSTVEVDGIRFTPYHAGHVLGAAMYLIEIAGVKVPLAL